MRTITSKLPNPFNPQTTIEYSLAQGANVRLSIYDMMSREVKVLVNGHRPAGKHTVRFDASHLTSGSYLYRIRTETYTAAKAMMLHR
ncbi:MAG: T9SS type A sorting domain-containing protein [Bacteroidetes bacterium SB0662_bin_6]|nr:T9SS type A sorting domain-containing protein [Bacteroidetes bacterium SB0662_bin_6]MYE03597.1 T9SS type A sorting domain-containing protein [Bacteroidetes bacterium SB0662_bin_6]